MKRREGHDLAAAGQIANQMASDYLFADYLQRRSKRTAQTQLAALVLWVEYLREVGAAATLLASARQWAQGSLTTKEQAQYADYAAQQQQSLPIVYNALYSQHVPVAWHGVTRRLCQMAAPCRIQYRQCQQPAGNKGRYHPPTEQALIREVKGYGLTEGKRVDEARPRTRVGHKKEEALVLTAEQARLLKTQHPLPRKGFGIGCWSACCWIWASGPVKWLA